MTPRMLFVVRAWPWVLAALVLFPVAAPGFVLSYDMVFVPDLALRSDFLGLGSGLPRAVPSDAVVAVVDEVLPGEVLQKLLLVGALGLGGTGIRRLVPATSATAQLAATSAYLWNPYVAERLGIGHWTVLLAYAALPWIIDAARRLRRGEDAIAALTLWLALSALSPSGGVVGAVAAVAMVVGRSRPALLRTLKVGACAVLVNLPWLVAGVLQAEAARTDPDGVVAFAARGEGPLPVWLTTLGLGGIWNAEVVPASRLGWATVAHLVILVVIALVGVRRWCTWLSRRDALALGVLGLVGWILANAGALLPGVVETLVSEVPGAGLFRDGARFLLLLAPLQAALFGMGASVLLRSVRQHSAGAVLAVGVVLAPVALMPDLGAGLAGALRPVSFPAEYDAARAAVAASAKGAHGDLLVLPFSSYRRPAWNDRRRTLDPLGRYLTPNYLVSDDLYVSGVEVSGEDRRAARVEELLAERGEPAETADALRAEGIRWVVRDRAAERDLAGTDLVAGPVAGEVIWDGPGLVVQDLGKVVAARDRTPSDLGLVALAWSAALGAVLLSASKLVWARRRRTVPSGSTRCYSR